MGTPKKTSKMLQSQREHCGYTDLHLRFRRETKTKTRQGAASSFG
jgi:hypothetical protein